MTRSRAFRAAVCAALCLLGAGNTAAELFDRGGGLIYDSALNVTWLQDASYSVTSGFSSNGLMTWQQATAWADSLVYHDTVRNVDWTDWRLPTVSPVDGSAFNYTHTFDGSTDVGYNVSAPGTVYAGSTASELAYMFFNTLGNKAFFDTAGLPQSGFGLVNSGPFTGIQNSVYWSGTLFAQDETQVWVFPMGDGGQGPNPRFDYYNYAWLVRSGDVAPIPEPETYALLLAGLGLLALGGCQKRKRPAGFGSQGA